MNEDSFAKNILGVADLIGNPTNKVASGKELEDGVIGDFEDILDLPMSDDELKKLSKEWVQKSDPYEGLLKPRQDRNKLYYQGKQRNVGGTTDSVVSSNLIFESEETFIPQALSNNPEPVVWSDNTDEGKEASNDIKTMLQYHADILCLRKKLGVMVRQWSIYFIGVVKHGWEKNIDETTGEDNGEITTMLRKPQNFLLDPDGYIDEYGNFIGAYLGEKLELSASDLIDLYPAHKDYITEKVNQKLGTLTVAIEWWTDKYCFTTFGDEVLDKHKNQFFNYDVKEKGEDEYGLPNESVTPAQNHFAKPKMPYTFLSVFSLQEKPHDITNLIEQNIANQNSINDMDDHIFKNIAISNNAVVLNGTHYDVETAKQAVEALTGNGFVLDPGGDPANAMVRLPAPGIPNAVFENQQNSKDTLRSVFGTQGLAAQSQDENQTARGMILNQSHDSSRIGGGIGDSLEQVADNIFNWWLQLYYVFYDTKHYGAVMGNGRAVEYVGLIMANETRKFVVSVVPNSMTPKDEVSEQNQAIELWQQKALDPITLFKKLNYPDPLATAKQVALWVTNPQMYMQIYFPEQQPQQAQLPPQGSGQVPPEAGSPPTTLAQAPANAQLNQVPLPK